MTEHKSSRSVFVFLHPRILEVFTYCLKSSRFHPVPKSVDGGKSVRVTAIAHFVSHSLSSHLIVSDHLSAHPPIVPYRALRPIPINQSFPFFEFDLVAAPSSFLPCQLSLQIRGRKSAMRQVLEHHDLVEGDPLSQRRSSLVHQQDASETPRFYLAAVICHSRYPGVTTFATACTHSARQPAISVLPPAFEIQLSHSSSSEVSRTSVNPASTQRLS